jgi:lysozyme
MKISDKCLKMIKHHEGVRTKPYQCPALLWTVGVGHVIDPTHARVPIADRKSLPIPIGWDRTLSMDEVDDILQKDLARFVAGVLRLCPETVNNQNHLDALVSFSFNVGLGNLQKSQVRMKYNRGDFDGAMDELLTWNKAGGKVLKGLDNRRKDEKALFLS